MFIYNISALILFYLIGIRDYFSNSIIKIMESEQLRFRISKAAKKLLEIHFL